MEFGKVSSRGNTCAHVSLQNSVQENLLGVVTWKKSTKNKITFDFLRRCGMRVGPVMILLAFQGILEYHKKSQTDQRAYHSGAKNVCLVGFFGIFPVFLMSALVKALQARGPRLQVVDVGQSPWAMLVDLGQSSWILVKARGPGSKLVGPRASEFGQVSSDSSSLGKLVLVGIRVPRFRCKI